MTTQWQPKMKSVISELLETMFFMSVDFEPQVPVETYRLASSIILARDLQKIQIDLFLTEPFAREAASNFLGVGGDEVSSHDIEDVVKEIANMVAGSYMTRMEDGNWNLGIPSMRYLDSGGDVPDEGLPISYLGEQVGLVILSEDSEGK